MKIVFQMEMLEDTNPESNHTLTLINESCKRGYEVYQYHPNDIFWKNGEFSADAKRINVDLSKTPHFEIYEEITLDLKQVDVIMFRQDPSEDMAYITNTYMLERLEEHTFIVNKPRYIRELPDKFYPLDFQEYMPPTLITSLHKEIASFLSEHNDVVVKPLYGFHGYGIERFSSNKDLEAFLKDNDETYIIQPFLKEIKQGNKRIIFLDGEISSAIITVPAKDEYKIYRNSTDHAYELTEKELEICKTIGKSLKEKDLLFVGIDLIGEYLTEINLGSVGSIIRINEIYNINYEVEIIDLIEKKLIDFNKK